MKTRLIICLSVELLIASGLSAVSCVLRSDEVRALSAWRNSPTAETKAEMEQERRITFRHHVVLAGVLWAGMAVITVPIVIAASRSGLGQRRMSDVPSAAIVKC